MAAKDENANPVCPEDELKEGQKEVASKETQTEEENEVTLNIKDLSITQEEESSVDTNADLRDEADLESSDRTDAWPLGKTKATVNRPAASMPVARFSTHYNMQHKRRGFCVIIAYSEFSSGGPRRRDCARHDAKICKEAFAKLNYTVSVHWNLPMTQFYSLLDKNREVDHTECDSLVVIFMSHGGVLKNNKEYLWVYDAQVYTCDLWKGFTPKECPSLAGKPKMFFIQACRGKEVDKGVRLRNLRGLPVQTDSTSIDSNPEEDYAIPLYADMLMMWASFQGMFAFKSKNYGINGSVFLQFLAKVLKEDAEKDDLISMLMKVTREVAIHYESYVPGDDYLHHNKQIPQMVSTLMRKVSFIKEGK